MCTLWNSSMSVYCACLRTISSHLETIVISILSLLTLVAKGSVPSPFQILYIYRFMPPLLEFWTWVVRGDFSMSSWTSIKMMRAMFPLYDPGQSWRKLWRKKCWESVLLSHCGLSKCFECCIAYISPIPICRLLHPLNAFFQVLRQPIEEDEASLQGFSTYQYYYIRKGKWLYPDPYYFFNPAFQGHQGGWAWSSMSLKFHGHGHDFSILHSFIRQNRFMRGS